MGTIVMWEALTFGLDRLADAAHDLGHDLVLLIGDRTPYRADLAAVEERAARGLPGMRVVQVDTHDVAAVDRVLADVPDLVALVTNTDGWAVPASSAIEARGLPGKSLDFVRRMRDKAAIRQAVVDAGLSRSQSVRLTKQQIVWGEFPALEFPCVVKDVRGTASAGVHLVRTPSALDELRAVVAESAVEEYVVETMFLGPMYSAEAVHFDGTTRLLGVSNRVISPEPWVREESFTFPVGAGTDWEQGVSEWLSALFEALKVEDGIYHTEFVMTAAGPELVEVNNRLGGTLIGEALQHLGLDVHRALLQFALGERPDLLDAPRGEAGGFAEILVYAPRTGVVVQASPLGDLSAFPGDARWYPTKFPGDQVVRIHDQAGCLGLVSAVGADSSEAQDRALAAARSVARDVR